jgi:hypothetical protein
MGILPWLKPVRVICIQQVISSFKLGRQANYNRDPGGKSEAGISGKRLNGLSVLVIENPKHYGVLRYYILPISTLPGSGLENCPNGQLIPQLAIKALVKIILPGAAWFCSERFDLYWFSDSHS